MASKITRAKRNFSGLYSCLGGIRLFVIICEAIELFHSGIENPGVARPCIKEASDLLWWVSDVDVGHVSHIMIIKHLNAETFIRSLGGTVAKSLSCFQVFCLY